MYGNELSSNMRNFGDEADVALFGPDRQSGPGDEVSSVLGVSHGCHRVCLTVVYQNCGGDLMGVEGPSSALKHDVLCVRAHALPEGLAHRGRQRSRERLVVESCLIGRGDVLHDLEESGTVCAVAILAPGGALVLVT